MGEVSEQEAAVHHRMDTPRTVAAAPCHFRRELVPLEQAELGHTQLLGSLFGQVQVLLRRALEILESFHKGEAGLSIVVGSVQSFHAAEGCERKGVVSFFLGVCRRDPSVVRAGPRRRVVDLTRVDNLEWRREILGEDGDVVAMLTEVECGAEADNAGTGCHEPFKHLLNMRRCSHSPYDNDMGPPRLNIPALWV